MWNQSLQTHAKMYQIYVEWVYTVGLVVGRPPEFPSSTGGKTSGIWVCCSVPPCDWTRPNVRQRESFWRGKRNFYFLPQFGVRAHGRPLRPHSRRIYVLSTRSVTRRDHFLFSLMLRLIFVSFIFYFCWTSWYHHEDDDLWHLDQERLHDVLHRQYNLRLSILGENASKLSKKRMKELPKISKKWWESQIPRNTRTGQ